MENIGDDVRVLQLSFIGKIIASFTHEIKNYVAIVKESAGLIGDMIKLGKTGKNDSGQYFEIIDSIEEQIGKTTDLFKYLNRFAHRMDSQLSSFNINESLEDLIALLSRFANQRRISFQKDFQKDIPSIYNNPSMLQLLVFCYIDEKLKRLDRNSSITVKTGSTDSSVTIRIISKGNFIEPDAENFCSDDMIEQAVKLLRGVQKKEGPEIALTLPASVS